MSSAEPPDNFICCCHTCQAEQTTDVLCPDCGPASAHYVFVSDEAIKVPLVCRVCAGQVAKDGQELQAKPTRCQYCRSTDLGWRRHGGEWRPEPAHPAEEEGPWIRGDFDGDFGGTSGGEFRKLGSERDSDHRYSLIFKRAQLENVALVDGPPPERKHHDRSPPLRVRNINGVFVYRQDDSESSRVYRADLVDVHLHDWAQSIDEGDLAALKGRLQGVAYARLRIPTEKQTEKEKLQSDRTKRLPEPVPEPTPDPGTEREASAPLAPPAEPTAYCNTCNLFALAAVALILYLACRWQNALLGVAVMALQCWWRSRRMANGRNSWSETTEKVVGGLLVLLALLAYLGARYQECMRFSAWWLLGMAVLLILTALLRRCWSWLLISLLWVLMLLSFYCKSFGGQCELPAPSASTSAPVQVPGFALPSLDDLNPLPSLQTAFNNVVDGVSQQLAIDQDSHSVEDENSGRISLDQALSNPEEYFNCDPPPGRSRPQAQNGRSPYEITFSEAALFGLDKSELRPGAEAHLRKLARLIDANPNVRIVLTGHADASGSAKHNLELSQRRAQTVADWLISEGHMKPEQIDVRGAGDRYPIVNDPRLYRYNRRVDLSLDCSGVKR